MLFVLTPWAFSHVQLLLNLKTLPEERWFSRRAFAALPGGLVCFPVSTSVSHNHLGTLAPGESKPSFDL